MVAKKTETDIIDAPPTVSDESALRAQNTQMLDMLIEMREELDAMKARQAHAPSTISKVEAELNAELADLKEEFKDHPMIQMFENRVVLGQEASTDIRLKDDSTVLDDPDGKGLHWKLRWFNFSRESRAQQASHEGYEKVPWDALQDEGMVPSGVRIDGYVRRGDKGHEVLHRIPQKLFAYKQKRDAARREGKLQSESYLRDHVANGVARMAGNVGDNADQAGTFSQALQMSVTPGQRETVTL